MSSDPVNEYASSIVKRRIASLCLALGWNSTHSSAMDVSDLNFGELVNILLIILDCHHSSLMEIRCLFIYLKVVK